jgi:hypothetical protein
MFNKCDHPCYIESVIESASLDKARIAVIEVTYRCTVHDPLRADVAAAAGRHLPEPGKANRRAVLY